MKLKSILKTLSLPTLEAIHRFWEFNQPKDLEAAATEEARAAALVEFLYPRLQLKHSFQAAHAKLDKSEKDLIFFLAIHGGDLETTEVAQRCFGGSVESLQVLVEHLTRKGFVFADEVDLGGKTVEMTGLPEPYLRFVELPSYWEGYLGSFLKDLSTPGLKAIANQGLKLKLTTSRKHVLIWRIRRALTDPRFLREYVGRLRPEHRELVEALLEKRGISVYRELMDESYMRRYSHNRAEHIESLVHASGLVFTAVEGENKQNNLLMIPRDLLYIIRGDYHPDSRSLRELDTVSMPSSEPRQLVLDNSGHLLRDLAILVSAIRTHPHRILANGGVGKNELKKILPSLSSNKTLKYARFLTLFCIRRKFLIPAGEFWTVCETFEKWLANAQNAFKDLYGHWLDSTSWNEEYPEGDTVHTPVPPTSLIHAAELRRLALRNLDSIPHNDWMDFDAFAEGLVPQIELTIAGRSPAGDYPMTRHNVLALESVVAESLHWLGIVTLGIPNAALLEELGSRLDETLNPLTRHGVKSQSKPPNDYAFAFKLTDLGRRILDSGAYDDPDRLFSARGAGRIQVEMNERHFTVQPNLEILAPPDLNLIDFYFLCGFCETLSVDVMSTLALTKRSVRAAMDRGMDGETILAFLKERSNIPLPETVRQLVDDCASKHGEVHMGYSGGYILVGEPALLEEIRSNRLVREHIKDIVSRRLLLLTPQSDIPKLARELRKAGFMPHVDGENVHTANNGDFLVRLDPKDLYDLLGILKFVVAMEEELGTKVTEDKVRPLFERLQPDPSSRFALADFADTICKGLLRRYHAAQKKRIEEVAGRYKRQLARLLTTGSSLERRVAPFDGPNPAAGRDDVLRMLQYAIETETRVEISYRHLKNGPIRDTIEPESINDGKVYAFSDDREDHAMFRLSGIRKARLLL